MSTTSKRNARAHGPWVSLRRELLQSGFLRAHHRDLGHRKNAVDDDQTEKPPEIREHDCPFSGHDIVSEDLPVMLILTLAVSLSIRLPGQAADGAGVRFAIPRGVTLARREAGLRPLCVIAVVGGLTIAACARVLHPPAQPPSAQAMSELWLEPVDLETRDVFHGPGGAALTPLPVTYQFVSRKTTGKNPGYDVVDPQGNRWAVKLGEESQSEVTASRVLWALGFHQPPTYYVPAWQLSGADTPNQPAGRFRAELPAEQVVGEWSWYENPFIGSRPFAALVTVNLLLNNWDFKTSNNKIYETRAPDGSRRRAYVVRDLGAALGKARQPRLLSWSPFMRHMQGSKNNLPDFEAQGFIKTVREDFVEFDYRGIDDALVDSVSPDSVCWSGKLLARLSDSQWRDAFRAGGYTDDETSRYVRKVGQKIAEATRVCDSVSAGG